MQSENDPSEKDPRTYLTRARGAVASKGSIQDRFPGSDAMKNCIQCRDDLPCVSNPKCKARMTADAPTPAPTQVEGLVAHAEITPDGELRLVPEEADYAPPAFTEQKTWEIVAITMNQIADLLRNQNDRRYALLHEFADILGERSEGLREYAKTLRVPINPTPAAPTFEALLQDYADWIGANAGLKSPDIVAEHKARAALLAHVAELEKQLELKSAGVSLLRKMGDQGDDEAALLAAAPKVPA